MTCPICLNLDHPDVCRPCMTAVNDWWERQCDYEKASMAVQVATTLEDKDTAAQTPYKFRIQAYMAYGERG